MGKAPDDNDQHRAGTLQPDPTDGTEPVSPPSSTAQPGHVLVDRWKRVNEWGDSWLSKPPPPRKYLLKTDIHGPGVLPLGKVGMLAAEGGAGKSWALAALALSVATGKPWFGFVVEHPGPVAWLAGEEELEEMHRRLNLAAQVMGLDEATRRRAEAAIIAVPLCGEDARINGGSDDSRGENGAFRELQCLLAVTGVDWSLLILDPASRFAGDEMEIDSAAATAFVRTLEKLAKVRGTPTVLVSHHTNKSSRGSTESNAKDARGSSAFTDGVRWQANLDPIETDGSVRLVRLKVVKNNYGVFPEPTVLARDASHSGALRRATPDEVAACSPPENKTPAKRALTNGTKDVPVIRLGRDG